MQTNYAVEMQNVTKTYSHHKIALNALSLKINEGKITGLLGPNGAGKSTIFKILANLVNPNNGSIKIFGNAPSWQTNTEIAYLPDRGRWYAHYSAKEALIYASQIYPNFNLEKAYELAKTMNIDLQSSLKTFSKGYEARFNLIVCLARDVKLYLLDEPFSGIDLISREHIMQAIIESVSEKEQTIVISTHEIHEAESLFEEVIFINEGQLLLAGNTEALRAEQGSVETIYRRLFR